MAESAVVGILRALLTLDSAEFESGMKKASDSFKAVERDWKRIGQQATNLGTQLTKTVTLPLLAIGTAAAKSAMDFETSFAGVRKTVNATDEEFADLEKQLRNLAKTIPINVNEFNRLAEAAGALGIPKEEISDFARVMALLGVTTNVTADQAAESIAKVQNIFNAAGKETQNFASTLVALGNDGASTEKQILEMATRIAGAGNAINMTQGEVLAFASALSSVGIEAERGGSAISRVFIDIASSVQKGGDAVAGFARVAQMSTSEFSKLFKEDAAAAVNAFITGLGNIKASGGDLLGTLEALGFSEIGVRDTLLRTAGAGDLLTRALDLQKTAWQQNSALTEEARKRFETTESQLALLWNRVKDVGITLGNALLPMIKATVSALDSLVQILEKAAGIFVALPTPIQAAAVGLGLVAAAAGPAIYVFGQLALSVSALSGAFAANGIASRALATGITAVRAAALGVAGPILAAATALGLLYEASQKYGVASKMTDEQIKAEIESLRKVGGAMALSRAAALESTLAERQRAAATKQTTEATQALTTETAKQITTTKELVPVTKEAAKAAREQYESMIALNQVFFDHQVAGELVAAATAKWVAEMTSKISALSEAWGLAILNQSNLTAALMHGTQAMQSQNASVGIGASAMLDAHAKTVAWKQSMEELAQSFLTFAQIAGNSINGVVRNIGTAIAAVGLADKAIDSLKQGFTNLGSGSILKGLTGIVGGIGGIVGAAQAAVAVVTSLWHGLQRLFGGGEEGIDVNPNRDKFFGQYGGYEGLATKLTAGFEQRGDPNAGESARQLIAALYAADTRKEFDAAQDAIIGVIGGQKFHSGGEVPGYGQQLATVLGGERVLSQEQNRWFSNLMSVMPDMGSMQRLSSGYRDQRPIVANITVNLDGRVVSRSVMRLLPGELATQGIRP